MSEKIELYTVMPLGWAEEEMLKTVATCIQEDMPFSGDEVLRGQYNGLSQENKDEQCDKPIVKLTIEVISQTFREFSEDTQHHG